MKVERTDHDDYVVTVHQSWLDNYLDCPEKARQDYMGVSVRHDSDSTAVGTAVHHAIEQRLHGMSFEQAVDQAFYLFDEASRTEGFVWDKVKTRQTAQRDIEACFRSWEQEVYPCLGSPLGVEEKFRLLFDVIPGPAGGDVEIWLEGTIDYIDEFCIRDWKTTSSDQQYSTHYSSGGKGNEKKRWAIQPTVYTWAADALGYFDEHPIDFVWHALLRGPHGGTQELLCQRGPQHWQQLRALVRNAVAMHFAGLTEWPLSNASYLCSVKYCDAWATCPMGALSDLSVSSFHTVDSSVSHSVQGVLTVTAGGRPVAGVG